MALPTLLKTWRFVQNILISEASHTAMRQELMYQIKRRLVGDDAGDWTTAPSQFWVVTGSSNGTTADASDNWNSQSDMVWDDPGNNHSWISLRLVDYFGSGDHLELCIALNDTNTGAIGAHMTRNDGGSQFSSGFTGGTLTARPTATTEVQLRQDQGSTASTSGWMGLDSGTPTTRRFSMWASSDGREWRLFMFTGGQCPAVWAFGELQNSVDVDDTGAAGWDFPVHGIILSFDSDAELMDVGTFNNNSTADRWAIGQLSDGGGSGATYLAHVGHIGIVDDQWATRSSSGNGFDNSHGWTSAPLIIDTDKARPGIVGWLKDWWWGIDQASSGDDFPDNGSRQFVQIGQMVLPWSGDGTIMLVTA